jgi:hypothetical protein
MPTHARHPLLAALAVAALLPFATALRADEADANRDDFTATYQALVSERASSVVPVKYVITLSAGGQEQRNEDRTQGVLVSADGLVLVSARAVSIDIGAINQRANAAPGAIVANSSEFRVRLPGSDEWQSADLVTRDTELGLAWLRVRDAKAQPYIDFETLAQPAPGRVFYTLLRTSDEWGAVPLVRPGMVLGETRVPRTSLLVDGMPGLAFDAEGRPMGYVDIDLAAVTRSQGRGFGLDMADMVMHMLPARRVAAATRLAATLPVVRRDEDAATE